MYTCTGQLGVDLSSDVLLVVPCCIHCIGNSDHWKWFSYRWVKVGTLFVLTGMHVERRVISIISSHVYLIAHVSHYTISTFRFLKAHTPASVT